MNDPGSRHGRARLTHCAASLAVLACTVGSGSHAQTLSLSLSDNLVVLTDEQRSRALELVNLGDDPLEFSITASEKASGRLANGADILRWAPERALVQPHRGAAMRVSSRTTPDTGPGEYMFKAYVRNEVHQVRRAGGNDSPTGTGSGGTEDALSVTIPISPSLPITVYVRHGIATPMIDAQAFVATPDDAKYMGHFPVRKRQPEYSFVGHVQVIDKASRAVLNQGRLHLPPGTSGTSADAQSNVRVAWPADRSTLSGQYCLRIWDRFPANGAPQQESCS